MRDETACLLSVAKVAGLRAYAVRLVLLATVATATAACSAPGGEVLGVSRQAASTAFPNDKTAYDYFAGKGLSNFQAAGVVGNLDQESGVDPTISQSGGGVGRGIAQWSTGGRWDTSAGDNVVAYAAMQGQPATSLSLQLDFIWYELETFSDYGLSKLRATSNVSDASIEFEDDYEGCVNADYPECDQAQRITYSMNVLNAYGADPVPGDAGIESGATGGGGSAGGAGASASSGAGGATALGGTSSGGRASAGTSGAAAAGSAGSAGSAAGSAGSAGSAVAASPSASDGAACAFASPARHSPLGVAFAFGGALAALALALRVGRRHWPVTRAPHVDC